MMMDRYAAVTGKNPTASHASPGFLSKLMRLRMPIQCMEGCQCVKKQLA